MVLEKINHSNEQKSMNTNNRNVTLQQHVVLLTVMEHAEDSIKKITTIICVKNFMTFSIYFEFGEFLALYEEVYTSFKFITHSKISSI
jgi:hypothetical protein